MKAHPGARITAVKAEKEEIEQFEVKFTAGGKKMTADVARDGTILETDEPVEERNLPAGVRRAAQKAAEGGRITGAEKQSVTAVADKEMNSAKKLKEPQVRFVVHLSKGGMSGEVIINADGSVDEPTHWREQTK